MHTHIAENDTEIPTVTFYELNEMALDFISKNMPEYLCTPMAFDIDHMLEILKLSVIECEMSPMIMGVIPFIDFTFQYKYDYLTIKRHTILLNKLLHNNNLEKRFTKAHEAAHWLIFERYKSRLSEQYACSKEISERSDVLYAKKCVAYLERHPDALEELHTDVLACKLTMPEATFVPKAKEIMKEHGFEETYFSSSKTDEKFDKVIDELAEIYLVPAYAVCLHLQILGLFVDCDNQIKE